MNFWDIFILIIVGILVILAFLQTREKNKKGGCSCGCANCSSETLCKTKSDNRTEVLDSSTDSDKEYY